MDKPLRKDQDSPLRGVRANIVQSIRAFRVQDLQDAAGALGHHFLYSNLAHAQSKQDVLDLIAQQFTFLSHFGKKFDALSDCLTDPLNKSGPPRSSCGTCCGCASDSRDRLPMNFRPRAKEEPEINLIPFIDVLLVILIFLMLTTTYSKFTELQLTLPVADAEQQRD